jgi:ribosome-associated protein
LTREAPAEKLARYAAGLAAARKAQDIVVLDLRRLSSVTDFFVLCSGRSRVQVQAVCENILAGMGRHEQRPLSVEGLDWGHWALLDFGEVVVHVFQQESRSTYDLERLWRQAPRTEYEAGDQRVGDTG